MSNHHEEMEAHYASGRDRAALAHADEIVAETKAENERLREEARSWRAVAERLEGEAQELLSLCEAEIRDQTNNRQASDKRSAAYAEGALRVARGIASRIKEKAHAR